MQNNTVMVSIICTTYNHEKYIKSCIEGFFMQKTDFDYEIIIHDDCSTDSTADIIRSYLKDEPTRIKAILQSENQYSKGANIVGDIMMPLAKGKYIAFCEGDDVWIDDTKLSRQVDFLEKNLNYVACVHNTLFHRCDKYCKDFPMFVHNTDKDLEFEEIFLWNAFGYQYSSLLARREFFIKPQFGYGEYSMAIYLSLNGKIRFINRVMSEYRFRSSKYATRSNVFCRETMIRDIEGSIEELQSVKVYLTDESRKKLVDNKISESLDYLKTIQKMKDEEYDKFIRKREKMFDLKLFIRSHFKKVYKIIKRKQ